MENEKFNFFVPIDIKKAKDKKGNDIMKIGGVASTADVDSDGEVLEPSGYQLDKLLSTGFINWHHQSKSDPTSIIGEPTKAFVKGNKLFIEGVLYPESPMAHKVYETAKMLEHSSSKRRLGFSIEGKPIEFDPFNKKRITKASITGVAITHAPKNGNTLAQILKGEVDNVFVEDYEFSKSENGLIIDEKDEQGNRYMLGDDFNLTIQKAATAEQMQEQGVSKESLEGAKECLKKRVKERIKDLDMEDEEIKKAIISISKLIE